MRLLRDQPIERRLLLLVTLTSAMALALGAVGLLAFQWLRVGDEARQDAKTKAELVAGNLSAALQAGDAMALTNIQQALKEQPQFREVLPLIVNDGNFVPPQSGFPTLPKGLIESVHVQDGSVYVYRLVQIKGGRFGVVYVQCPVQPAYGHFATFLLTLIGVFAVSWVVAVASSARLRRTVGQPIQALWQTMRQAAANARSPLSEAKEGTDELADLKVGFNGMMSQIQSREAALQKAQSDLETHVAERTRELQQEILQRRRVEAALADEKERLAVTLRSIGDAVVATDRRGQIALFNAIAEELTGWKTAEALGRPLREVLRICNEKTRQPCEDPVQVVLRSENTIELSGSILIARNGTERLIADSGAPIRDRDGKSIGVVLVFRDVTEKQRMAEELLKSSKLESIGLMAGGIAHDFNNILTAILGNVSLAKLQAPPGGEFATTLSTAEKAAIRARDLTRQLLAFAKGGAPVKKTASLVELIKENTEFVLHGSSIRCALSVPADLWPAEVDVSQFNQVIQNLVLFGVRAMLGGGNLEVRAANVTLSEPSWVPLPAGNYVMISFQDHGQGIAPEDLPRIFDPYFATKESGHGLGLAAACSIVKRHDGHIAVESKLGRGTAFHVYLPASSVPKAAPSGRLASNGDRSRILVMDDDAAIRDVAQAMLDSLGYEVALTEEGGEAIERYREAQSAGRPFAAVILDLTVQGGMGGQDTLRELLRLDKNVKAIVSSGYYDDPVVARYREYGFCGTVPKPYGLEELDRTLREIVGAPRKEKSPWS